MIEFLGQMTRSNKAFEKFLLLLIEWSKKDSEERWQIRIKKGASNAITMLNAADY